MTKDNKTNSILYLQEVFGALNQLRNVVQGRNKTDRMKGLNNICDISIARCKASLDLARAGGEVDLMIQQSLWTPIVQFIGEEASR